MHFSCKRGIIQASGVATRYKERRCLFDSQPSNGKQN
nr:MAG TPA: hypothetical protein [Bacteriophage sp.]